MGIVLVQFPPITSIVSIPDSESFQTQIVMANGNGVIEFTTTVPNPSLSVSGNGTVTSTVFLPTGSYVVSGFATDERGDTGDWVFTLDVSPEVSTSDVTVTPLQPILPTGSEVAVPFQIDPATGGIAVKSDYSSIIAQHLLTIIQTQLGERVMNPGYGSPAQGLVFSPAVGANLALIQKDIKLAIQAWEPAVNVSTLQVSANTPAEGIINVDVYYSILPHNSVSTLSISTGGSISQVVSS